MSSKSFIRLAEGRDAEAIQAIYAPFVRDRAVSFEVEPPSAAEMRARVAGTLEHFPWLVCERAGEVAGYVYACAHRTRAAYRWAVDVAAYVHPAQHRGGVGRALYASLFALLRAQGFHRAYAGITLPNVASVGLHEAVGFRPVGVYEAIGWKAGAWHSVGWWQLSLIDTRGEPGEPLTLAEAMTHPGWNEALAAGAPLLRR